jgi:putative ABC transport system substrate-binding protein
MNRRDAVLALLALGVAPLATEAQQPKKLPTVGFLALFSPVNNDVWNLRLKERGWIEGQNVLIERAYAEGRMDRLPALAANLVMKQVDVIYASGPDATVEAARATKAIPIVFFGPAFPIEQGLVDSLARPGRNVTGIAWNSAYIKQLELVRQIAPRAKRVAHFFLPTSLRRLDGGEYVGLLREIEATGRKMGLEVRPFRVAAAEDFDGALKAIKAWRAQALIIYAHQLTIVERKRIVSFVTANRIPSFSDWRGFAEAGGLISYGPLISEMTVQAVGQIDRILRGARPADLPVELPTRFEFVINRKTAGALGIKIPQELLLRADEVIG